MSPVLHVSWLKMLLPRNENFKYLLRGLHQSVHLLSSTNTDGFLLQFTELWLTTLI